LQSQCGAGAWAGSGLCRAVIPLCCPRVLAGSIQQVQCVTVSSSLISLMKWSVIFWRDVPHCFFFLKEEVKPLDMNLGGTGRLFLTQQQNSSLKAFVGSRGEFR